MDKFCWFDIELKIFEQKGWDYNSYFKFVFIRNPYTRLVSLYNMSSKKIIFKTWIEPLKLLSVNFVVIF